MQKSGGPLHVGLFLLCAASTVAVYAAQPNSGDNSSTQSSTSKNNSLKEVVVTARRRQENIQRVPISIVAKTGDELAAAEVPSIHELSREVPGLVVTEGDSGGGEDSVYLRGIGTQTQSNAVDPSVGTAVDGVVEARPGTTAANFDDIARVEVLRGPQGTLFGQNTSGGLINIVTKDPTDTFTGDAGVQYGSYDEVDEHAAVSGPLAGDELLGRLSAYSVNRGGYITNINDGRMLNDDAQAGARAKLLFKPADDTSFMLEVWGLHQSQNCCADPEIAFGPATAASDILYNAAIVGPTNSSVNVVGNNTLHDNLVGTTLQGTKTLSGYVLTSITAWQDWRWQIGKGGGGFNSPALPPLIASNDVTFDQAQWSQELRLASPTGGRVDYQTGLFFFGQRFLTGLNQDFNILPTLGISNETHSSVDTINYAGYGEANFHVTRSLILTTGARLTHESKTIGILANPPLPGTYGFLSSATPGVTNDRISATNLSWRFGVRWELTPNEMLYATASRGFKGPGFNTNSTILGVSQRVRPETSTNYELGWKATFLDSRVRTSLTLFDEMVNNFQAQAEGIIHLADKFIPTLVLANAGRLDTRGVEFQMDALALRHLTLALDGAYDDGYFGKYLGAQCYAGQTIAQGCIGGVQDLSGARLPSSPTWSANTNATYHFELPRWPVDPFIRADYSWHSPIQWSVDNDPHAIEGNVGLLGLSVGLDDRQGHYTFTAYVKNLTNKYNTNIINGGDGTISVSLQPDFQRTFGLTFEYRFE